MARTLSSLCILVALVVAPDAALLQTAAEAQTGPRPDVVLIVTDDQRLDSMRVMEKTGQILDAAGTEFAGFVANALCCPSRASILTGRYSHSTGVYRNTPPNGGWEGFQPQEPAALPVWLQGAGYRTGLVGKYINHYDAAPAGYVPPGWNRWFALKEEQGDYYEYDVLDNESASFPATVHYGSTEADYSTDVIARESTEFISSTPTGQPLFLLAAPFAPHEPTVPAPRYVGSHAADPVTLPPSFNETDVSDKPPYVSSLPTASKSKMVSLWRQQWEAMEAVDDLVEGIANALTAAGRQQNTLFVYTSDNSVANGEHRWKTKYAPYTESTRVPFLVRYDAGGYARGVTAPGIAANIDIAPTIADFAGVVPPVAPDGVSLRRGLQGRTARTDLLIEHMYPSRPDGKVDPPSYCAVRTATRLYVRYSDGFEEFYRYPSDPYELSNKRSATDIGTYRDRARALCAPLPPGMTAF